MTLADYFNSPKPLFLSRLGPLDSRIQGSRTHSQSLPLAPFAQNDWWLLWHAVLSSRVVRVHIIYMCIYVYLYTFCALLCIFCLWSIISISRTSHLATACVINLLFFTFLVYHFVSCDSVCYPSACHCVIKNTRIKKKHDEVEAEMEVPVPY